MGNNCSVFTKSTDPKKQPKALISLYVASRDGNSDKVRKLLPKLSVSQINSISKNGSTALHAASYYGHAEIVALLLNAGASRSIRNLRYQLTAFEEAKDEEIRRLFFRFETKLPNDDENRFCDVSEDFQWIIQSPEAELWKKDIYEQFNLDENLVESVKYFQTNYLNQHLLKKMPSKTDQASIHWFFDQAMEKNDMIFFIKAYTAVTPFYRYINQDLSRYLLRVFRWHHDKQSLTAAEQSVWHFASTIIRHLSLHVESYKGQTYRGMIISEQHLKIYTLNSIVLNKSFISTTKDRRTAEVYAAVGDSERMRHGVNKSQIQFNVLCLYKIQNDKSAFDIHRISEVPWEAEVLILPMCAFKVVAIRTTNTTSNNSHIEIEMVECSTTNSSYFAV